MTRQVLNRGTTANDGTGDTLRAAALKIEQNFEEIYLKFGGTGTVLAPKIAMDSDGIIFEGASEDANEIKLTSKDATADHVVAIPDYSGEIVVDSASQTLLNKILNSPTLNTPRFGDATATHNYIVAPGELTADRELAMPVITGSDEWTFNKAIQEMTNKTITSPKLNNPLLEGLSGGGHLLDSDGNEYIEFSSVSGAINHISLVNATNGNTPTITGTGGDTNVSLGLAAKGAGAIRILNKMVLQHETVTASGSVSLTVPFTRINSGSATALTVADGTVIGESKVLVNINSGTATINPSSLQNYSSISMPVSSSITLMWTGAEWVVTNNLGATLA